VITGASQVRLTRRFCRQRGDFWMSFELMILSGAFRGAVIPRGRRAPEALGGHEAQDEE
jgi:hypothetical protein